MNSEFGFNIWFIVDIGTSLCRDCIIRCYNLAGSIDEVSDMLEKLAETDYKTAERIAFAEDVTIDYGDGQELKGYIPGESISAYFEENFDYFADLAEKQLPPRLVFSGDLGGSGQSLPQDLGNEPMYVLTMLMENEFGEMRPYTTDENMAWFESEIRRLETKTKELLN